MENEAAEKRGLYAGLIALAAIVAKSGPIHVTREEAQAVANRPLMVRPAEGGGLDVFFSDS